MYVSYLHGGSAQVIGGCNRGVVNRKYPCADLMEVIIYHDTCMQKDILNIYAAYDKFLLGLYDFCVR